VDGTVNQVSFNAQGQVNGYSASTSDGIFDTPGGSSGPGVANLNPYTGAVTNPGDSVSVTANQSQGPGTTGSTLTTLIPLVPLGTVNLNLHYVSPWHPSPNLKMTGDQACYFAPDAVSAIHSLRQGNVQGPPQSSTDGEGAVSINQNTTRGARVYGNQTGYAGAAAGFMILDGAVSVANCLQGH